MDAERDADEVIEEEAVSSTPLLSTSLLCSSELSCGSTRCLSFRNARCNALHSSLDTAERQTGQRKPPALPRLWLDSSDMQARWKTWLQESAVTSPLERVSRQMAHSSPCIVALSFPSWN
jgi:hypothetical protein